LNELLQRKRLSEDKVLEFCSIFCFHVFISCNTNALHFVFLKCCAHIAGLARLRRGERRVCLLKLPLFPRVSSRGRGGAGPCRAVLCCAVLRCAVLCCAALCCAALCCAVLCCAALCCAVLRCAALCCAALCCAVLCCELRGALGSLLGWLCCGQCCSLRSVPLRAAHHLFCCGQ